MRSLVAAFYAQPLPLQLLQQVTKYRSRVTQEGNRKSVWTHRDLLRLSHFSPKDTADAAARQVVLDYVLKGEARSAAGAEGIDANSEEGKQLHACQVYIAALQKLEALQM